MKVVILAGGFGTRLSEETVLKPKPLVEIGERPIIWHIMKHFSYYGFDDFIVCCGYRGSDLKKYFVNYFTENYDITVDLEENAVSFIGEPSERWKVTLVDTGTNTMTGGRLRRVRHILKGETFLMTYGDGLSDVNVEQLVQFHRRHGKLATVTAVPSPGRYGILALSAKSTSEVAGFVEKPTNEMGLINGGFFVLEDKALDFVTGDSTSWEQEPIEKLASKGELQAFTHTGFWKAMDTLRDKRDLDALWQSGSAPWLKK